jgi:hypothetical protein
MLVLGLCALMLCLATACGQASAGAGPTNTSAPQPTATLPPTATPIPGPPTPTNVPSGWQVYSGAHFTIAYPPGWSITTSPAQTGLMGGGVILASTQSPGNVTVTEAYGYTQSQLQSICQLTGTPTTLAGISMKYSVGEGVHRTWAFLDSKGVNFTLDTLDATQPQSVQQTHDSILATFRPDDPISDC